MVKKVSRTTKGKSFSKKRVETRVDKETLSRRDLKLAQIKAEMGADPATQRERMRQSGKTKRAVAYSGGVATTGNAIAQANQEVYYQMASGGLGYEEPTKPSEGKGGSNNGNEVIIGR